jgi:hypothetical protein
MYRSSASLADATDDTLMSLRCDANDERDDADNDDAVDIIESSLSPPLSVSLADESPLRTRAAPTLPVIILRGFSAYDG